VIIQKRHQQVLSLAILILFTVLFNVSIRVPTASSATPATDSFSPRMLTRVGSSSVVYLLGFDSCQRVACLRLLRTTNNGASFTRVTAPPTTASKGSIIGSLEQLVFASAQVGYALEAKGNGNILFATFNGGRTWKKELEPKGSTALLGLTVTSHMLYAVTSHCAKQPNGNEGCTDYQLQRASLAVKHWSSSAIPNGRKFPWGFLGNVAAFGPNVWLTEGAKWSLLASSHNYGATFTTYTPPSPALISVAGCDLTAISSTALWSQCPTGMQVSFYFSDDAGTKWVGVPTDQFMGTGGGYFDPVSSSLAYLDYGGPRPLYRVTNSGHDVTKVGVLRCSSVNSSIGSLVFTSELAGLAICTPQDNWSTALLERTSDGGATWSRLKLK
jgi:hypothetical protein